VRSTLLFKVKFRGGEGMKKILTLILVLALIVGFVGLTTSCKPEEGGEEQKPSIETRKIVALLPLTGVLGTFGENSKETALLAAKDVNYWLERNGKNWRLEVSVEDTATDPTTSLKKMKDWYGAGVKFFVGPMASGSCKELLTYANSNKILFVSPSSTSTALSIPDDYLIRFCPDDFIQGPAIARLMWEAGVTNVIFVWRGDTWGDGLQSAIEKRFTELGGKVYSQKLRYDPQLEDFPKEASLLNNYVQDLINQGIPKDRIGISLVAFEESAPLMEDAAQYQLLKEVRWFGSDGTALSEALKSHKVSAPFATTTNFISTFYAPGRSKYPLFDYVRGFVHMFLNRETDSYSYGTYDIVWSLALAIDQVGYDPEKVKDVLPEVTDKRTELYGASGHIVLNENGDRAFADYDLWLINDKGEWEKVGVWRGETDTIEWTRNPYK